MPAKRGVPKKSTRKKSAPKKSSAKKSAAKKAATKKAPAKKGGRTYGPGASKSVKSALHRRKSGTLKSGSGQTVTSKKQAIAIGLSEAREKGAKVPPT